MKLKLMLILSLASTSIFVRTNVEFTNKSKIFNLQDLIKHPTKGIFKLVLYNVKFDGIHGVHLWYEWKHANGKIACRIGGINTQNQVRVDELLKGAQECYANLAAVLDGQKDWHPNSQKKMRECMSNKKLFE